jgi:hypothetical protein
MANKPIDRKARRLEEVKSAYILEAQASLARGLDSAAMALFVKAGELEVELAELLESKGDQRNAQVSLLSAGSCFLRARQYRRAVPYLERAAALFPEARELIAECQGKDDALLTPGTPGLQALIGLLVKKHVIDEAEWAEAIGVR